MNDTENVMMSGPLRLLTLLAGSLTLLAGVAVLIWGLDRWAIEHLPNLDGSADAEEVPAVSLDYVDTKYALITLDELPLHEMDEAAQGGTIDPEFAPAVRTLVRILSLTDWLPELEEGAAALHEQAVELLEAIESGEVENVREPAAAVHESTHEFTDEGWEVVGANVAESGGGH
jgi:hypothetical protein